MAANGSARCAPDTTWNVPLRAISDKLSAPSDDMLSVASAVFEIPHAKWLKLNAERKGLYRTLYSPTLLERIRGEINSLTAATDRMNVISDAFAIASAGYASVVDALRLLPAYRNEQSYVVWAEIIENLEHFASVWYREPVDVRQRLDYLIVEHCGPAAEQRGWDVPEKEDHLSAMLRPQLLRMAGLAGHRATVAEAQRRFAEFVAGNSAALHPDVRGAAYAIALAYGGRREFDAVKQLYADADSSSQKVVALSALAGSREPELVLEALRFAMSGAVPDQDVFFVVSGAARNAVGREPLLGFLFERWHDIHDRFSKGELLLSRIVSFATDSLCEATHADGVSRFFEAHPTPSIARVVRQSVEKIRTHAAWLSRDRDVVANWLRQHPAPA